MHESSAPSPSAAPSAKSHTVAGAAEDAPPSPHAGTENAPRVERQGDTAVPHRRPATGRAKTRSEGEGREAAEEASRPLSPSSSSSSRSHSHTTAHSALQPCEKHANRSSSSNSSSSQKRGPDEDVSAQGETQSSGSTTRNFLSTLSSGAAAAATASLSLSAPMQRPALHNRPTLSAVSVALPQDAAPAVHPPQQQQQQQQQQRGEKSAEDGYGDTPAPPPRATREVPAMLALTATYRSVPVLPPQVFRSVSSAATTSAASVSGGVGGLLGGNGPSVNSAASTPVLSPPQPQWFSPSPTATTTTTTAGTTTTTAGATAPMSPPLRSTGFTTPVSSITGTLANTFAASSPTNAPARVAYALGGSRRRNSVSVPTHASVGQEDNDDAVNTSVVDEVGQSAEQWLVLSPSASNVGNTTVLSTAVTSRSSSRDHGSLSTAPPPPPMEDGSAGGQAMRGVQGSGGHTYQPPSTWSLMRPQALANPRATAGAVPSSSSSSARGRRPATASATSPPPPPLSHANGYGYGAVPDPPAAALYIPASGVNSDSANTPLRGRSVNPSRDHSLALSLRSPLQSPPSTMTAAAMGFAGGRGGAVLSRRSSLGSLRLATHDPYNAAVMSPVVMPRPASLSSLRSPSATLTSPTGPPSAMALPTGQEMSKAAEAGGVFERSVLSHSGHRFQHYHQPERVSSAESSTQLLAGRPAGEWPPPSQQQQPEQPSMFPSSAASSLVSPMGHRGAPVQPSSFPHSPQTWTAPAQVFAPPQQQQQQQQHQQQQQQQHLFTGPSPQQLQQQPQQQPRRRNAREALSGFFSEVPIELGDQTHLVLDRNGVPYHDSTPGTSASLSNNAGRGPSPPPLATLPSSAYAEGPARDGYRTSANSMVSGPVGGAGYASYPPAPPPEAQQQQQHQQQQHQHQHQQQQQRSTPVHHGAVFNSIAPPYNRSEDGVVRMSSATAMAGGSAYCTDLDSRAMRAVAYGESTNAGGNAQFYNMSGAMYTPGVSAVSDGAPTRNSGGGNGGGVSYEVSHHTRGSTSPSEGYSYGFGQAWHETSHESDAQPTGRTGESLPPPQHRVGAVFSVPRPRSTNVLDRPYAAHAVASNPSRPPQLPLTEPTGATADVYSGPAPNMAYGQRHPPPPPPPAQQQQQQQQQLLSQSYPSYSGTNWSERDSSRVGPPQQQQQHQMKATAQLNRAPDSALSPYPYKSTNSMEVPASGWTTASSIAGSAQGQTMSSQMYDSESAVHDALNSTLHRGGKR